MLPIFRKGRDNMAKKSKKREYNRIRKDTGQHRRIGIVSILLGVLAFVPVTVQLLNLMVRDYDYYARLALQNQTRTTQVTADRGLIYDRNMNILACSQSVENVYLDPRIFPQSLKSWEKFWIWNRSGSQSRQKIPKCAISRSPPGSMRIPQG